MQAIEQGRRSMASRERANKRLRSVAVCAALFLATPSAAQVVETARRGAEGNPGSPPLLLGDVFAEVRARNPKAAAARSLADAAGARVRPAGTLPDPEVQLGFMNYRLPGFRPMDPLGMVQLQVMQMLPLGGKLPLSSRVASYQAAAARERAADVTWELRTTSAMAFYELYAAEQGITIAIATRRLVQDVANIAQTMYEVGDGNQADLLRAQVEIARMTEEVERMDAMRSAAAAKLNALLDRSHDAPVSQAALPPFPASLPSIDSLLGMALRSRPMIRAGEEELAAMDAMALRSRRELFPDLVVGVQYAQRSAGMGTEHMGSLMLGASIPIFARSRQLQWREEADAMRAMSAADLNWMKADTRGRIGEVLARMNRARRLGDLYRRTVLPQAEAAVTSSLAAYRVGRIDFMNVLDSRMTVNRYRQELVTLQMEEGQAWAELEMLVGQELFDPSTVHSATNGRNND